MGWFFNSSVILFLMLAGFYLALNLERTFGGVQVSSSVFSVSRGKILPKRGDDLRWAIQVREPGRHHPPPTFWRQVYPSPPQPSHISALRAAGGHESGSPSFTLSESLKFAAAVNTSAAARQSQPQ